MKKYTRGYALIALSVVMLYTSYRFAFAGATLPDEQFGLSFWFTMMSAITGMLSFWIGGYGISMFSSGNY
jgi:multisubunit Na+/H+ antiporter MnhF subunit